MKALIYLDYAATGYQKPECVIEAVCDAMREVGNPERGANEASLRASRTVYNVREKICDLFDGDGAGQVAFTKNATESLNIAIYGLFQSGDHIITTIYEHNSVLRPLYQLEKQGVQLSIVSCNAAGQIDYDDMEARIQANTKAIICTHASNVTGILLDIHTIGMICRRHGLLFLLDASQTAGVFPLSMKEIGIDVLCFTGHKGLMGPQGIGGLCVRKGVKIRSFFSGGSGSRSFDRDHPSDMPSSLEAGTLNLPGIAGLGASVDYLNCVGIDSIRKVETEWLHKFYYGVAGLPGIRIMGGFYGVSQTAILSLNIGDDDSGMIGDELSNRFGILVRSGIHCAPLVHKAFHTEQQGAVRFSFSVFHTKKDIEAAIKAVQEICMEYTLGRKK